jgi:hypothetical protein
MANTGAKSMSWAWVILWLILCCPIGFYLLFKKTSSDEASLVKNGSIATAQKESISWGWVIFWFVFIWPLGLFLLFRKINSDRAIMLNDSKKVTVISFVLIVLGVLAFSTIITNDIKGDIYTYLWAIALVGGGVWTFFVARKMKDDGVRYKKYIALVVNQNQTSIDNIAAAVGVSYDAAAKDLQKMIDDDYFQGACIDVAQREIVLAKKAPQQISQSETAVSGQKKIATCKSCGAKNKIKIGQVAECEYCGSFLA